MLFKCIFHKIFCFEKLYLNLLNQFINLKTLQMKKIYVLLSMFLLTGTFVKAQDTLLFEDFELTRFYDTLLIDCNATATIPPGVAGDMNWYSMDSDGDTDGSGGSRPDGWFALQPFSVVDQYETVYGGTPPDTNTVLGTNSWTTALMPQQNWLITSSVQLGSADTLFWKSAPRQTPRYLDGYEVRLSTTTNADNTSAFSNVLFNASQMTVLGTDTTFSTYTFAPTAASGAFVHGLDGTHIDYAGTSNSHQGQLRQFSVPLNAYANQAVYIAIIGNSADDNLVSIDDVMIRGTLYNSINENKNDLSLNLFPNPATDNVQVNYTLSSESMVTINLYDVTGKLVATVSKGEQPQGRHFAHINTSDLAKGFYTVNVVTSFGASTSKLIVR